MFLRAIFIGTQPGFHHFSGMSATNKNGSRWSWWLRTRFWVLLDVAGALEEQGYLVLCARNADDALSLFEDRHDIGVVFTDISMPGSLNGLDLARQIRRHRPDVGVLVTSGHYREMDSDVAGYDIFIPKPYEPKIVISRIASLVDPDIGRGKSAVSATPCYLRSAPAGRPTDAPAARYPRRSLSRRAVIGPGQY